MVDSRHSVMTGKFRRSLVVVETYLRPHDVVLIAGILTAPFVAIFGQSFHHISLLLFWHCCSDVNGTWSLKCAVDKWQFFYTVLCSHTWDDIGYRVHKKPSDWSLQIKQVPDISLGRVVTCLMCGGIFSSIFITNFLPSLNGEKLLKSVSLWWS